MRLFDDIKRQDAKPQLDAETQFHFLNHSAMGSMDDIRTMLEDWFYAYPAEHQLDLRNRFRSSIDCHHHSAFFELFLHEFLLQLGCEVTIHPEPSPDVPKRPDFLVKAPDGNELYLEATVVTGKSDTEVANEKRVRQVYDLINTIDSPNFFLQIVDVTPGASQPPTRKLRKNLTAWLASLDPDEPVVGDDVFERLPIWSFTEGDWKWIFKAIPKKKEARGLAGVAPIGMYPMEGPEIGEPITAHQSVHQALTVKSSRYGKLDRPYVIAVNGMDTSLTDEGVLTALFGHRVVKFDRNNPSAGGQEYRAGNGVWGCASQPNHTRLSGVLAFLRLTPYNVHLCDPVLYHNPWASRPLPATALPVA